MMKQPKIVKNPRDVGDEQRMQALVHVNNYRKIITEKADNMRERKRMIFLCELARSSGTLKVCTV